MRNLSLETDNRVTTSETRNDHRQGSSGKCRFSYSAATMQSNAIVDAHLTDDELKEKPATGLELL